MDSLGVGRKDDLKPMTNMRNILGKKFSIKSIRKHTFKDGKDARIVETTKPVAAINFKTKESMGEFDTFYADWKAVKDTLDEESVLNAIAQGKTVGPVKLGTVTPEKPTENNPTKKPYYVLETTS